MPSAADYIRAKTPVPAELRTVEWNAASAQAMERAFVMASVDNARTLEQFQAAAADIAAGRLSTADARQRLRALLDKAGYTPEAGLEGTIKDLSTPRRMELSLRTNVEIAFGYGQRQAALAAVGYPGWRLVRAIPARVPRDWVKRWQESAREVGYRGVARNGAPVALVTSPIWAALSRWGRPSPPFDFNSGMAVEEVDIDECERLGLMGADAEDQLQAARNALASESFNADTVFEPRLSTAQMRARLGEDLQGIAEWDGDTLRLTDPNGTRPYKWDEIGEILAAPNKAGVPHLQLEAAQEWMEDNRRFYPADTKNGNVGRVSLDVKEDFARLVRRIDPIISDGSGSETVMRRGLQFDSTAEREAFIVRIREAGYGARPGHIAESWTNTETAAADYAASAAPVILVCDTYHSRKRFDGLYRVLAPGSQDPQHPHTKEGESLFPASSRFRYLRKEERGGVVYIYVEETE